MHVDKCMQESTPSGPCGHLLFWILFGFIICTPLLSIIRALCSRMPGSKFAHSCDWCAYILNAFGPLYAMLNCFQMLRSIASECSQRALWLRRRYLLSPVSRFFALLFSFILSAACSVLRRNSRQLRSRRHQHGRAFVCRLHASFVTLRENRSVRVT